MSFLEPILDLFLEVLSKQYVSLGFKGVTYWSVLTDFQI